MKCDSHSFWIHLVRYDGDGNGGRTKSESGSSRCGYTRRYPQDPDWLHLFLKVAREERRLAMMIPVLVLITFEYHIFLLFRLYGQLVIVE